MLSKFFRIDKRLRESEKKIDEIIMQLNKVIAIVNVEHMTTYQDIFIELNNELKNIKAMNYFKRGGEG